jgi:hypothetical protein
MATTREVIVSSAGLGDGIGYRCRIDLTAKTSDVMYPQDPREVLLQ